VLSVSGDAREVEMTPLYGERVMYIITKTQLVKTPDFVTSTITVTCYCSLYVNETKPDRPESRCSMRTRGRPRRSNRWGSVINELRTCTTKSSQTTENIFRFVRFSTGRYVYSEKKRKNQNTVNGLKLKCGSLYKCIVYEIDVVMHND